MGFFFKFSGSYKVFQIHIIKQKLCFVFINYLLILCPSDHNGGLWSRNIFNVGNTIYEGRRCGGNNPGSQTKCRIENRIFTRMQQMTHYCCHRYWLTNKWIGFGKANSCPKIQLAYWLWLPGNLADGLAFNNRGYFDRLETHINLFDPALQPDEDIKAQMCNCGHSNNNNIPRVCTHQVQPHGVHPSLQNPTASQTVYPFFAWPTTHISNTKAVTD